MNSFNGENTFSSDQSKNLSSIRSTAKKKFVKIDIEPLRLTDFKKELEEAELQPDWDLKEFDEEDLEPIIEEESLEKACNPRNQPKEKLCDSFDIDFSHLPLATPAKPKQNVVFATPKPEFLPKHNTRIIPPKTPCDFQTPKNKVQCCVNMQTYLKTPIEKLTLSEIKRPVAPKPPPAENNLVKIKVNNTEYIVLNTLGKGGSSEVFQCYCKETKSLRAIKCVSLGNKTSAEGFLNEVNLLRTLQKCNRIITMFDSEINEDAEMLLVVLEVGGVDLHNILKDYASGSAHIPVYMVIYYWMEMLYAVKQIHENGVIHSDLKPANFLQAGKYLKLIDFGIATRVQSDKTSVVKTIQEGSFNYISPEALINDPSCVDSPSIHGKSKFKLSYKSDVWSLGCILYQLVYKKTPFHHFKHVYAKLNVIMDENHKIDYPEANWVPPKILETIKKCLQFNMRLRPSVNDLISEYETFLSNNF